MLLYQYAYYVMREEDKRRGRPVRFTRIMAFSVFSIVELWLLVAAYLAIDYVALGHRIAKLPINFSTLSIVAVFAGGLVIYYINRQIIGDDRRIHHYKEIFDTWDKGKRLRWNILVIGLAITSLAAFFVVGEISQNGFDPQSWKY